MGNFDSTTVTAIFNEVTVKVFWDSKMTAVVWGCDKLTVINAVLVLPNILLYYTI